MVDAHYREPMLRRIRSATASTVWVLVVSLAAAGFTPLLHAADCHDADCTPVVTHHVPGDHALQPLSGTGAEPQHCILCHLARGFRLRPDAAQFTPPSEPAVLQVSAGADRPLASFVTAKPSPRAPPRSSLIG
jgi:hypothetical protein